MASSIVPLSVENCKPDKNTPVMVLNGGVMSAEHVGGLFQTGIFCVASYGISRLSLGSMFPGLCTPEPSGCVMDTFVGAGAPRDQYSG